MKPPPKNSAAAPVSPGFAGSLDPRRWSLTLRLTLFFSITMAAILATVSIALFQELYSQLLEKDEAELRYSIQIQKEILHSLETELAPGLWEREWEENINRTGRLSLRVLNHDGSTYSESKGMSVPASEFPRPVVPLKVKQWSTHVNDRKARFLLTSDAVRNASGGSWVIQGSFDLTQSRKITEAYGRRLWILLSLGIAAATGIGWAIVRRGLAPVREISAEIGRIGVEKLHARIGNKTWPAELRVLAYAFDQMLGRLEMSFERLTRFSSDLAHEFRTPINNLVAAASVTLSRDRPATEYQETLAVMVEEGERLSRMVSGMLFLARAENAQQAVHPERLSTAAEFQKLIDFFEALAEEHRVTISAEGDFIVEADPFLLRRALSNLITNALRHTAPGGAILLRSSETAAAIELSVSDTGNGIAPEHLPHLFDRFYRADSVRSASENTGLGLAVVKSIAELHSGSVTVDSAVGHGSTFTLVWPKPKPA